jgi:hypothetical protein
LRRTAEEQKLKSRPTMLYRIDFLPHCSLSTSVFDGSLIAGTPRLAPARGLRRSAARGSGPRPRPHERRGDPGPDATSPETVVALGRPLEVAWLPRRGGGGVQWQPHHAVRPWPPTAAHNADFGSALAARRHPRTPALSSVQRDHGLRPARHDASHGVAATASTPTERRPRRALWRP